MELRDDHSVCRSRLRDIAEDIASLRAENSRLRSANAKLLKLLAICPRAVEANTGDGLPFNCSPPSMIGYNRRHCERQRGLSPNRVPLRSRMANGRSVGEQSRIIGHKGTSRVQEQPGELELHDQGALKTELCNKWEATGACPYGRRCRFAHGIGELRPISQDHRYKTDVCRVVRDGQTCPYGHRCHFRHSLTRQEMIALLLPR